MPRHPRPPGARLENPTKNRLKWVVKNYNWWVCREVFRTLAEALGMHHIRYGSLAVFKLFYDRDKKGTLTSHYLYERQHKLISSFPETSEFDKYLGWLAREINIEHRKFIKFHKDWGDERLKWNSEVMHSSGKRVMHLGNLPGIVNEIIAGFASVVAWAEGEGVNLYDYNLGDALNESYDYEVEIEGGPVQGDVVYEFEDGWTIQELRTDEQLDYEGKVMQHCVGSYSAELVDSDYNIYSLRDPNGKPHVTMEIDRGKASFEQIKGKQNVAPVRKYREYIFSWMMSKLFMLSDDEISSDSLRRLKSSQGFITGFIEMFDIPWLIEPNYPNTSNSAMKVLLLVIDYVVNGQVDPGDIVLWISDYGPSEKVRKFAHTYNEYVENLWPDLIETNSIEDQEEMGEYLNQLTKKQKRWVMG